MKVEGLPSVGCGVYDALSKGKGTELIIESIEFDVEIPEHVFTKAALRK